MIRGTIDEDANRGSFIFNPKLDLLASTFRAMGSLCALRGEALLICRPVAVVLGVLLLTLALLPEIAEARKSILLVFDEDKDFPGLAIVNRSLREVFRSEFEGNVEFYSESLNLSQFRDQGHDGVLRDYYRRKYGNTRLDLIVAIMGPSLEFLLRYGEALFPGIPIVFCGAGRGSLATRQRDRIPAADGLEAVPMVDHRRARHYLLAGRDDRRFGCAAPAPAPGRSRPAGKPSN
jgi:hypothetical protein